MDTCIYCKKITTIKLINIHYLYLVTIFFFLHTWSHILEYEWLFVGVLGRRHSLILWSLDCLRITLVCVIKVIKNVQVATV